MDTNKGNIRHASGPFLWTAENGMDPDEVYSFIAELINQNAELSEKLEYLNSQIKLSEENQIKARSQAESVVSEIEREAKNRVSAIISEAENRAKLEADRIKAEAEQKIEDARQERINAAIQEGQFITQKAIEMAEIIKARAEEEAKKIIYEAEKEAEHSQKETHRFSENETRNALREENEKAPQAALVTKEKAMQRAPVAEARGGVRVKGALVYSWNMEICRQPHSIEIVLDTIIGLFATGSGRLLVDGWMVCEWGWNPFTIIPNGRLEFEVAGRGAYVRAKGTATNYPVLVLDNQEIPPAISKI
jgi:vacuolar-type H+-ATPase subunit H